MASAEYRSQLAPILDAASPDAARRLARLTADGAVVIEVFVDQDAEGPFDVWARFDGPDGFALDRRFDDDRQLFAVEWGDEGWVPAVPARPRGWSREELEEEVLACVAEWLGLLVPATSVVDGLIRTPDGALEASLSMRDDA